MNIVEVRSRIRRLSVPRRSVERDDGSDRRQCTDRRKNIEENQVEEIQDDSKKYVRINLTPGEKTMLQDMYLLEDE